MKIKNIIYSAKVNKLRLSAQLVLNSGKRHEVYFEVDKEFKDFISHDASPFVAAALAIAMKNKEDLEIDGAISTSLMTHTSAIMNTLKTWGLGFSPILINATAVNKDLKQPEVTGCFFSGGVDSFYTYLKNKQKINYLIFVHGFDISAEDAELYKSVEKNITEISRKEKVNLIQVKTNIRDTFERYFDWDVSHEFALGAVALLLRFGFKKIYVSCGLPNKRIDHQYMTPELDRLWSTENMNIMHFGCNADKIIKLKFLSSNPLVMKTLRVCWMNRKNKYNCGECEKCFRNMLALYVSDSLEKCKTFNKGLDLERLKHTRLDAYCLKYFTAILKRLKLKNDTSRVRLALEECIRNSQNPNFRQRLINKIRDSVRLIDNKYNRNRLFWYLSTRGYI